MTIRLTHAALLEALTNELPHVILGQADGCDIEERREHAGRVTRIFAGYLFDLMQDTNVEIPLDMPHADPHGFRDGLSDLFQDTIGGPLMRAEEAVREDEGELV